MDDQLIGFVIYRTDYRDDENWNRFMAYLNNQAHSGLSDPELQDAGPIEIRERFNKWLKSGEEAPDDSYRYMACVLVDSATLNSVDRWMKDKTLEDDRLTLFDARGRTSVWLVSCHEEEGEFEVGISYLFPQVAYLIQMDRDEGSAWDEVAVPLGKGLIAKKVQQEVEKETGLIHGAADDQRSILFPQQQTARPEETRHATILTPAPPYLGLNLSQIQPDRSAALVSPNPGPQKRPARPGSPFVDRSIGVELMIRVFRDDTRYKGSANAVGSFDHIRAYDAVAADLLLFISCIKWKAVPRSTLLSVQLEVRIEEAIGVPYRYSFLVRRYGDTRGMAEKGVTHVAGIFPSDDYANRAIWRAYLPYELRLLKDKQGSSAEEKSELCPLVGRCLQVDGRIREAVRWLEESCEPRKKLAYQANGQVKEGVELLEYVVAVKQRIYRFDHPSRLVSESVLRSWQAAS
ncbi:hypothetical protein BU23DRAFT_604210 [Bimuria novae-zelandiae CBS 107.79]|uniref:Heterokaryon incompatibility domain-containing protein n=1 Tax=Bimuria novae-zelandiae CBS 107.79 TaxID=1447943 RepID=A0A6A5UND4_9PLEO|nr:hypothetical protein BU23DRAFT_604210 [Bimuria novae-zelandiae CBS 107.79]